MNEIPKKHLFTRQNYLLDLAHLRVLEEIATDGDVDRFMSRLCLLFLKNTPPHLHELDRLLTEGDCKAIKLQISKLKGSCSEIGAIYMVDLCMQIEKALMDEGKDLSLARTLGEQLKDAFYVTSDQIHAYMAQLPRAH